ncbi:hypothetical protein FG386_001896 [Cryptosporidium ryanae]|uniref:uncharacterized protein n=1 Tax=Cryptosporidium ryanae TaxID=515981 RepID=UPI00351A4391|nr:hypothetical protein FG386_001896 [Cryptosporidium ryanae]
MKSSKDNNGKKEGGMDSCVGPAPFGISKVLNESSNKVVIKEFVFFTLCLILLPCGLFFMSPHLLSVFLPEQSIFVGSAILSVILVNVICIIYVYRAFIQEKSEWQNIGPPVSEKTESRKIR